MEDANKLYELILLTANQFLRSAKLFEINALQDFNPSFDELANIMRQVADVIYRLADSTDPMLAQKATDYVEIMLKMAIAIKNSNEAELSKLVEELDQKPFF